MGLEAKCEARVLGRWQKGLARLEEKEIVFRGDVRVRAPLDLLQNVRVADGVLTFRFGGEELGLRLGAQAGKWADLCCIDLSRAHTQPVYDPIAQLLFSASRQPLHPFEGEGTRPPGEGYSTAHPERLDAYINNQLAMSYLAEGSGAKFVGFLQPYFSLKHKTIGDADKAVIKGAPAPKDIIIDVIVAYTKKAAGNYMDVKRELVDLSIEEANESFRQSGVGQVKLRLVHAYQTDYVEEGAHFDHVWRFADKGDGYMDEIFPLREKYKADVAILIVDDPKGCGLATRVFADADEAFAVVHHECAAASYSLAHEIGHIIGARHDLNLDKNLNPFPYGHGFVNGTK